MDPFSQLKFLTIADAAQMHKVPERLILQWMAIGKLPAHIYIDRPMKFGWAQISHSALTAAYRNNSGQVQLHTLHKEEADTFENWDRTEPISKIMIKPIELEQCVTELLGQRLEILKDDFSSIRYGKIHFILNAKQAKVVQYLYNSFKQGAAEVTQDEIINSTGVEYSEDRIDKLLRVSSDPQILGVLVLKGENRATYKLAPFTE